MMRASIFRHSPLLLLAVALVALAAFFVGDGVPSAQAQQSPYFGTDGVVTTAIGFGRDRPRAVAVQSDGKIVAAGDSHNGTNLDFALARYNADGSLDNAFGTKGRVTTPIGSGHDVILPMALQSDGKIVVAGTANNGNDYDFALARYNADGSLDTAFGTGGVATTSIGSGNEYVRALALQSDGKIVAAGDSHNGSDEDFALARYNADGSLDTTFGTDGADADSDPDGYVTTAIGSARDIAHAVALQSDGKIVAAGDSDNGTDNDFALARYNADGSLDTAFGTGGKVTTNISLSNNAGYDFPFAIAVQPNGKIVAAGGSSAGNTPGHDFALARYNANGSLDSSFGTGGVVTTDISGSHDDTAYAMALLSNGKIVVAGRSDYNGNDEDFALARYNADGSLDTTFGTDGADADSDPDGYVTTPIGYADDRADAMALQSDGKIVLAGRTNNGNDEDFALARYNADGSLDGSGARVAASAIWTGALAVRQITSVDLGCNNPAFHRTDGEPVARRIQDHLCSVHLSPHTFSHGSTTYEIYNVGLFSPQPDLLQPQRLGLTVRPAIPEDWVLVVNGGTWLSQGDASTRHKLGQGGRPGYTDADLPLHIEWNGTRFDFDSWKAGGPVSLSLVVPRPGAPTVTLTASPSTVLEGGTVTVTANLSAAMSRDVTIPVGGRGPGSGVVSAIDIAAGETSGTATFTAAQDTDHLDENNQPITQWVGHQFDETHYLTLQPGLPAGLLSAKDNPPAGQLSPKYVYVGVVDDDSPWGKPTVSLSCYNEHERNWSVEGGEATTKVVIDRIVHGYTVIPLLYTSNNAEPEDYSGPASVALTHPPSEAQHAVITFPEDGDTGDAEARERVTVSIDGSGLPDWLLGGGNSCTHDIHDNTPNVGDTSGQGGSQGDQGAVGQGQADYSGLIAKMKEWRDDPQWSSNKEHTDRWDRALLAFGEAVSDGSLTAMSAAEAQGYADRGWTRWTEVAEALRQIESGGVQAAEPEVQGAGAGGGPYAALIAKVVEWRNDPQWAHEKAHTDRWDRALVAFGETVSDTSLTAMTAAEAQGFADRGWERWIEVAAALREIEGGVQAQQQSEPPNRAPTVARALPDRGITSESETSEVSLSGVFDDADGDSLIITAASSDAAVARVSVAGGQASLTVSAQARGTATITVTADDGNGGAVSDSFTVTVKAAPGLASAIADVSGLETGATRDVSLAGVFSDADGDALTVTASSSDEAKATVTVASDGSSLTLSGIAEGTATVTVTAQDSDGNRVIDAFDVSVVKAPDPTPEPETSDIIVERYDANGDGAIDESEWLQARSDFIANKITYAEMLEVYNAYLASG